MDKDKKERRHISRSQKKKLIELVTKHPELISCKVTQDLNYKDFQNLWEIIADECNSLPGPKKTWRRWRKTWQDFRSNTKKKHSLATNGDIPISVMVLTPAEQEALGIKNLSTSNIFQEQNESTEFVQLDSDLVSDCDLNNQMKSENLLSESKSSGDVENLKQYIVENKINCKCKWSRELSNNLEMLVAQEQHKIQLKEDYLNYKKDYLKKKLKLMKEQTEAVKSIAKELLNRD